MVMLLARYQASGRPLLDLAMQYATISKDLEDKEWALQKVSVPRRHSVSLSHARALSLILAAHALC